MKARTKLQLEVMYNHGLLSKRSDALSEWAIKECLEHLGCATKNRVICLDCGKRFPSLHVKRNCAVCPNCRQRLKIVNTPKRSHRQKVYFAIAEVFRGFQVIRNFYLSANHKDGIAAEYTCYEVLQHWIRDDGKREVVARNHFINWHQDSWGGCMEIRNKKYTEKYDIYPHKLHPESEFKKEFVKYGIDHRLQGLTPLEAISKVPHSPHAETLLKAKQYSLLAYFSDWREGKISRYWSSIKISLRNKYKVKDVSMWIDYLDLLQYFDLDLLNSHYVCPKNLKQAHNRLMEKKRKILEIEEMKRDYRRLLKHFGTTVDTETFIYPKSLKREYDILVARRNREKVEVENKRRSEAEEKYQTFIRTFYKMAFHDKELVITPLKSIDEFKTEGDTLNHCVYTNEYYKNDNLLILSARIDERPVETIEFDLKKMRVTQCRGRSNQETEYHNRILRLMDRNKNHIAERMKMNICKF